MFRLIGVIVGAAIAVGVLLALFGVPEFEPGRPAAESAVITLPLGSRSAAAPDTPPGAPGPDADPPAPAGTAPAGGADRQATPASEQPDGPVENAVDAPPPLRWYSFWSPFRSEIAASGFVTQLQRVTGLDYRIVRVEAGVYEVAFAYSDDDELAQSLSQISAATGLEMPGG